MRQVRNVIGAAILAGMAWGNAFVHAQGAHPGSLKAAALRLADMTPGFTQTAGHFISNAEAERSDHVRPGTYVRQGRLLGYESTFRRGALLGLIEVDDIVINYRSQRGAAQKLAQVIGRTHVPFHGHRFVAMSVGRVGDHAAGFTVSMKQNRVPLTLVVVFFTRNHYAAAVYASGLTGGFLPQQVVAFAHTIDHRLVGLHLRAS